MAIVGACAPGVASAATFTVNDDTSGSGPAGATCATPNFSAIEAAINGAAAGDTLLVCDGTYTEPDNQILITKAITIIGNGVGNSIIDGQDATGMPSAGLIRTTDSTNGDVTIKGFTVKRAGQSGTGATTARFAFNLLGNDPGFTYLVEDVDIIGRGSGGRDYGFYGQNADQDVVLRNSTLEEQAYNPILIERVNGHVTIESVEIDKPSYNTSASIFAFTHSNDAVSNRWTFKDNTIHNNGVGGALAVQTGSRRRRQPGDARSCDHLRQRARRLCDGRDRRHQHLFVGERDQRSDQRRDHRGQQADACGGDVDGHPHPGARQRRHRDRQQHHWHRPRDRARGGSGWPCAGRPDRDVQPVGREHDRAAERDRYAGQRGEQLVGLQRGPSRQLRRLLARRRLDARQHRLRPPGWCSASPRRRPRSRPAGRRRRSRSLAKNSDGATPAGNVLPSLRRRDEHRPRHDRAADGDPRRQLRGDGDADLRGDEYGDGDRGARHAASPTAQVEFTQQPTPPVVVNDCANPAQGTNGPDVFTGTSPRRTPSASTATTRSAARAATTA